MHVNLSNDLTKQGVDVFGSKDAFFKWLQEGNLFFGKKAPVEFLSTNEGIKFIEDRLVAMSYGDNV